VKTTRLQLLTTGKQKEDLERLADTAGLTVCALFRELVRTIGVEDRRRASNRFRALWDRCRGT
jgi:hypothetical protein